MQAETEGMTLLPSGIDFDTTLIPVMEILPDVSQIDRRPRGPDVLSIVELGKQLLLNARNGDTDSVRDLMCRGAPFTTDWLGTSALHLAAQNNHLETAEVLLRAGISRDARTKVDRTPLHMTAYEGHHEMAQLLLNYGAEVDSRDMLKMTPLHWAVEREHAEVMIILLEHGADPNAISKFNKSPISIAIERNRLDFVEVLQQEREIVNVETNNVEPTEIESATQNLIQLDAEEGKEEEQIEYTIQPQKTVQAPNKKQKMVYQQMKVERVNETNKAKEELQRVQEKTAHVKSKKHKNVTNNTEVEQPFKLLQAHGITMIPMDNDATIVENAMESGQTVVLTEAGKLALNLTRSNSAKSIKRLQIGSKKNMARKVITISADQIFGQNSTITSRAPNILKRTNHEQKNAGKIFLASLNNATFTSKNATTVKKSTMMKTKPIILQLDDDIPEIEKNLTNEIAELNRKLTVNRKEADELRRLLQKKDEEAEIYEQQIRQLNAQKALIE